MKLDISESAREKTAGFRFDGKEKSPDLVSPVVEDSKYRFVFDDFDLVKSYCESKLYLVVNGRAMPECADFDLVFCVIPRRIDEQPNKSSSGRDIPELGRQVDTKNSVLISDGYPIEGPENIIPSLVRLECPKQREKFFGNVFTPSTHLVFEFSRTAPEGEVSVQGMNAGYSPRNTETGVVQCRPEVVDSFSGFIKQRIGDGPLKSEFVNILLRFLRVRLDHHLARAFVEEGVHLPFEITDVQLCAI